ncbi:MAG: helix-turn-helix domain-containing protein [Erysipelotrichaceae bacterium]|nr:helix-turn-helix domain-containing protein [Erysipelotrichaceae bacterium]
MSSKLMKDIIYENRKKKQLTQEQLADLLNVSNKTVSKWERGLSYPDILIIPNLAKILEISINELFDTHDMKEEVIVEYDKTLATKYKQASILSSLLFIFSPLLVLIGSMGGLNEITIIGWVIGVGMIIASMINFILQTSKYISLIEEKFYKEKYIIVLKNCFSIYLLLISLPILVLIPAIFSNPIYSYIIIAVLTLLITCLPYFLIIRKYNFLDRGIKEYVLATFSLISYILGAILMIFIDPYPYICFIVISIALYFTIIFGCNKFKK